MPKLSALVRGEQSVKVCLVNADDVSTKAHRWELATLDCVANSVWVAVALLSALRDCEPSRLGLLVWHLGISLSDYDPGTGYLSHLGISPEALSVACAWDCV